MVETASCRLVQTSVLTFEANNPRHFWSSDLNAPTITLPCVSVASVCGTQNGAHVRFGFYSMFDSCVQASIGG